MTEVLMCQSVVNDVRGPFPCSVAASRTLFGIHLCGNHANSWRPRLQRGEKIRIHPERTLPLDHDCGPAVEGSKRCTRCDQDKPKATAFRAKSAWCRECAAAWFREHYAKKHPTRRARRRAVVRTDEQGERRHCAKCGEDKPESQFYARAVGRSMYCSACERTEAAERGRRRSAQARSVTPDRPAPSSPDAQQGARPPEGDASPAPSAPAGRPPDRTTHHTLSLRHGLPSAEVAWPPPSMRTPTSAIDAWDKQMGTAQLPTPAPAPAASVSRPAADPLTPGRLGQYVYVVEFTCSLCGRWVCDVEVGSRNAIALPKTQRCVVQACGGAAQRSGEVQEKYVGPVGREFWGATSGELAPWSVRDKDDDLEDVS